MTKEEFIKELERLRFNLLLEKDLEKRKIIQEEIVEIKEKYKQSKKEEILENRRNLK